MNENFNITRHLLSGLVLGFLAKLRIGICLICLNVLTCQGAVVTFDNPWLDDTRLQYKIYDEAGVSFEVLSTSSPIYSRLQRIGAGIIYSVPANGTPYMQFDRSYVGDEHVSFNLVSGQTFGVVSLDLADPILPFTDNVNIKFIGYKLDGSTVTNTFITPGDGSTPFINYTFSGEFSSDLTKVEIPSPTWAMDNLVVVPEPSTVVIMLSGLAALTWRARTKKR
jgi:hypothetical protein